MSANCSACHSLNAGSSGYPLFTDFGFDNLGVPKNLENPFYANLAYNPDGSAWVDTGLGGFLGDPQQDGKMKVPTLRNVDKRPAAGVVKAYMHNGALKSLEEVVRFYAMRGMGGMHGGGMGGGGMMCGGMMFAAPEVNANLADLSMVPCRYQSYLVTFLKTLSDGYYVK
jgi:cytochrome c peroxidase